jgi:surface polysaccharide O-acyltransferase-like enzyme
MSWRSYLFNINVKPDRLIYPDILRILACAAIVMVHTSNSIAMRPDIDKGAWVTGCVYYASSNWATSIFFMISGALLLSEPQQETKYFLKKRLVRVLLPLVVWSAIYVGWRYQSTLSMGQLPPIQVVIDCISSPASSHLWFLYTIIVFYLWAPMIKVFVQKAPREVIEYILVIGIVSTLLYATVQHFFHINLGIVVFILDTPGYFILGYYLHNYEIGDRLRKIVYALSLASVPFMVLGVYLENVGRSAAVFDGYFLYRLSPFLFILVIGVFVYIKRINWNSFAKKWRWFSRLAATGGVLSFGVYLIHPLLQDYLRSSINATRDGFLYHPIISIPVVVFIITILSFIAAWLISKIPVVKRIIGA